MSETEKINLVRTDHWQKVLNQNNARVIIMIGAKQNGELTILVDPGMGIENFLFNLNQIRDQVIKDMMNPNK